MPTWLVSPLGNMVGIRNEINLPYLRVPTHLTSAAEAANDTEGDCESPTRPVLYAAQCSVIFIIKLISSSKFINTLGL